MNRLTKIGLILLSISVVLTGINNLMLQKRIKALTMQVQDIGNELDNVEAKLNIDKESVQD